MGLMSMTGFGRARAELSERYGVSVVVRSVNHRYLDVQVRTNLREEIPELEAVVRSEISDRLQRGRVTAQVNFEQGGASAPQVTVNVEQVSALLERLATIPVPAGTTTGLSLGDVLAVPGLITVNARDTILDDDETAALRDAVVTAVESMMGMRAAEGERLRQQITDELGLVIEFVDWFEPRISDLRQAIMERARERIQNLMTEAADPDRIVQEAAILADKADVAEEVVRLRAHFEAFSERLAGGGTIGRTLDFLCQEIHRELNTLGSKCREPGVAERLVDAKSAAERVREQVQNLE
ncbi:MAG: YicC/YloC family endoribonuclease [Acidobacteriota bacterium]|nr:YicC/YloC family endoribonuclease [Acidobacteriota bacterium]